MTIADVDVPYEALNALYRQYSDGDRDAALVFDGTDWRMGTVTDSQPCVVFRVPAPQAA